MTASALGATRAAAPDPLEAAKLLHRDGRLPEAERAYRAALAARPDDARTLHFLAVLLDQRGDGDGALALFERATAEQPGFVPAQMNLARLLARRGALERAEQVFRRVLPLAPDLLAARLGLAAVLHRRLDIAGAIEQYRAALVLAPDDLTALTNLGAALQGTGDTEGAEACLRRVLTLAPHDREALNNLGNVLMDQSRGEEAAAAFRAALAENPGDAQVRANLGNALEKIGDDAGARAAYRACLATQRSDALRLRLTTIMPAIPQSVGEIDQSRAEFNALLSELEASPLSVADPLREIGATAFYLAYHGYQDRAFQERLARLHARACPALLYRAPHCRIGARPAGRRLRVGFVSTFLRNHTIGRLNRGLIGGLDRKRFEVTVFAPTAPRDEIAREIHAAADRSVVLPADLDGARRAIGEAALDLLYYTDIGMVPLTYFLAFARLAPVQVTTWGHPLTTGIANVDHFISLAGAEPEGSSAHYSERLARFPGLSTCYRRPGAPLPRPRPALGLPEHGTVYLCVQSLFKFHPDFDCILAAILAGDPEGRIALLDGGQPQWTDKLRQRLTLTLPPEAMARVVFVPRTTPEGFLALLASADVVLDTTVFCGGNTTLEALAVGTPVVTLPSPYLRGRLSLAMYRQIGFTDLVAKDEADYARIALALGRDKQRRAVARDAIQDRAPTLFDDPRAIAEHERFFLGLIGG